MATKRTYFTRNISGYIDLPASKTADEISRAIQCSVCTVGIKVNKDQSFIHKSHIVNGNKSI